MNRITIGVATLDGCGVCGNDGRVVAELLDWNISRPVPCPRCRDAQPLNDFVNDHVDYLARPSTPGDVIA